MRLFDTHCHFESCSAEEIAAIISRAKSEGVDRIMAVGGSAELNESALLASHQGCLLAQGYDRDQISVERPQIEVKLDAYGEIGLDYYYSPETRDEQIKLFSEGLEEAKKRDLPVVIHTRYANDDTLALLREIPSRGIIHCFTGEVSFAKALLDLGFYISYSGIVTFKAASNVRQSAVIVPDDRILIETDSPFLAPVPMRGNKNEPAYIKHTCRFLSQLRNTSAEDFAELTYANAERALS
jgi:TatD DNase family protein